MWGGGVGYPDFSGSNTKKNLFCMCFLKIQNTTRIKKKGYIDFILDQGKF